MSLAAQTTDFTYTGDNNLYCAPANVNFVQTSSGTPKGYLWSFGNGVRSNVANPSVVYDNPGTYTIRLIVVYENSTAEMTKTIIIRPSVNAYFSTNRNEVCLPSRISFEATTGNGIVNYEWNFGDASPIEAGTNNSTDHHFENFGEYNTTLKCRNTYGCEASYSKIIKITQPLISGTLTKPTGCVPASNTFTASVTVPQSSTVNSYQWNFGDGNVASTATRQVTHIYNTPGNYQPTLTITTNDGCTKSYQFDSVRYGIPPTNLIAYPLVQRFCGSEPGQFVAKATNADAYQWDFGGGNTIIVRDTFIERKFTSLGIKTVKVTPTYNGCPGQTITMQVEVIGVIAGFNYQNTCNDKKTFIFRNTSDGNLSTIIWRFGDPTPYVTDRDPLHTFPTSGTFRVKLFEKDNITGCIDSAIAIIYTANPALKNPDSSICINTNSTFRLFNNYTNTSATYTWDIIGNNIGPNANSSITVPANILGSFTSNSVIINNGAAYCPDTIYLGHPITVRGPMLDFDMPANICLNTPLSVTNLSRPYLPTDSIKLWYWNFGRFPVNDTTYQPAPYQYSSHRTYQVKLTAIDKFGCKDSLVKPIAVRPMPFLWIIPRIDTLCLGESNPVIAYTSDNVLWTASIAGPAFCNTCDSAMLSPVQTTRYVVTSTNSFNCSVSDSALLKVYQPFTAVPAIPVFSVCEGEKVRLEMNPKNKKITWLPPAGISNTNANTTYAAPRQSTLYTAQLTDSAGCFSSNAAIQVTVNPKPLVDAGPDKIFPYYTSFSFTPNYSPNVRQFEWSPADSLSCSNCPAPLSIATRMKTYTIKATSDSGCVSTDQVTIAVECKNAYILMPGAFSPNNDGLNERYTPLTRGIKLIKHFGIYNRTGQLIFELHQFAPNKNSLGWDGRFRGIDQPAGAYVYIIDAVCDAGQEISKKGSLILVR